MERGRHSPLREHPRRHVVYRPGSLEGGQVIEVPEGERHHLYRVRRARPPDRVVVLDGRGGVGEGELLGLVGEVRVLEVKRFPRPFHLIAGVAVARGERMDWLVEKVAELGVAEIVPFHCERAPHRGGAGRVERWRRIAVSALKQSRGPHLTMVHEPHSLDEVCRRAQAVREKGGRPGSGIVYLDPGAAERDLPAAARTRGSPLAFLVGPEGGFSDGERRLLDGLGASPVAIDGPVLRVETAAVVGAALAGYGLNRGPSRDARTVWNREDT